MKFINKLLTPQSCIGYLLLSSIAIFANASDFPGDQWSKATPKEAGLNEAKLNGARDFALTGGGSGCIIRGGKLVLSWGDPTQRYDLKSTTKSFGAAALGLAIKDGKVRLSDKARLHHPTLGTPPDGNADTGWLNEITILHLASHTAGFDKPGGYVPLLFKPGTEWAYSDGEWNGAQILPRDYVDKVRTTQPGVPGLAVHLPEHYGKAANHYGLLWWNNADETIEGVPRDTYWTWGLYDSLIVVMPRLDIVIARAGRSWPRTKDADHYEVLKPFLLPIVAAAGAKPATTKNRNPSAAPYPPSPVIQGIQWAPTDTIIRKARGSDNWPMTWADDDRLYTA